MKLQIKEASRAYTKYLECYPKDTFAVLMRVYWAVQPRPPGQDFVRDLNSTGSSDRKRYKEIFS